MPSEAFAEADALGGLTLDDDTRAFVARVLAGRDGYVTAAMVEVEDPSGEDDGAPDAHEEEDD